MPWKETCVMDERVEFIGLYRRGDYSMSELCREFGISRKTGYKYLERYRDKGIEGLVDCSRAPGRHPNAVPEEHVEEIITLRGSHPSWGPRKLGAWLIRHHPEVTWPAPSTIGEILSRHGLVVPRRRSRRSVPYSEPFVGYNSPNDVWCADFKGWFRTGDGSRCDPFTLTDGYSRFILRCQAVIRPDYTYVRPLFYAAFREYGLPRAIRTDNGPPFVTTTLGGLSRLSIEWIKLGIIPERIEPGKPAQNGRHERMHRTLKQETAKPPKPNPRTQQLAFDHFRREYNYERPHEALSQKVPADMYSLSPRQLPLRLSEIDYPDHYVLRKVHSQGDLRWKNRQIHLSETLAGETVGFEQVSDSSWDIYFATLKLATFDDQTLKMEKTRTGKRTRIKTKD